MNSMELVILIIVVAVIIATVIVMMRRARRLEKEERARDQATRERLNAEGRASLWLERQMPYI